MGTKPGLMSVRLEAFSDGVLAIIITIMVLELKVPHETDWSALRPLLPVFAAYVLSFVYVGIYWNNHHHLLYLTERVDGSVLWANLHLLFWLSLIPFVTGWLGENALVSSTAAAYGGVLLFAAVAWQILQRRIVRCQKANARLREAIGRDLKGKLTLVMYVAGIGLSFLSPWIGIALYAAAALVWIVPDRRMEEKAADGEAKGEDATSSRS